MNYWEQFQNAVGEQLQKLGEQLQSSPKQETTHNLPEDKKYDVSKTGFQHNIDSHHQTNKAQKHILVLLIKSDRYQDLIHSLKNNRFLRSEDSFKLYGATQGLWIGKKSEFDKSQIKQKSELVESKSGNTASEYDVHFVTIELDKDDSRFYPDVNPMDRRDAFIDLVKRSPQVTVSRRMSCKAYENTEFYSR